MIVILKDGTKQDQVAKLQQYFEAMGLRIHMSQGENSTIMGLIGDTTRVDAELIASLDAVEAVRRIQEPYKNANRKFHPADTVVDAGGVKIGGGHFQIIAGPCSVESETQMITVARAVKAAGATLLRGGAFKPRTSPYAFQGLHEEGLRLLLKAKEETGLPIVTEIMDAAHLPLFEQVDVIQVGARNMQNFELLKELGKLRKPILLKRGLANTLQELQVDILKYPHHGLNKLNDDFYKAVFPGYAVITNNGTKSAPAKQYLRTKHVPFALTVPGFVSCVTDGSTWLIQRLTPGQIVDVNAYSDQPQEE